MSGGRKNFFQQVIDNIKQEFTKNKEMRVCAEIKTMFVCLYLTSIITVVFIKEWSITGIKYLNDKSTYVSYEM